MMEWLQWLGWTAVFFACGILVDMAFKYRFQLVWAAAHADVPGRPKVLTKPSIRHFFTLLIVCAAEYLHQQRVRDHPLSPGVIVLFVPAVPCIVLSGRDSVRELKGR